MKNKPDAERSIRKGWNDIGGFRPTQPGLPESFFEGNNKGMLPSGGRFQFAVDVPIG
jgi:hypothetical protein